MDTQSGSDIPSPDTPLGEPKRRQPEDQAPPKQQGIRIAQHPGPGLQHPHEPTKRY